jgi:UPF0271 protein
MHIDLNCDMGESREAILDGTQGALLHHVTSANIACGGHAGDEWTMRETVRAARVAGVSVGAHPGYPDPENFGRLQLPMSPARIADTVFEQVTRLAEIAGEIVHVKPHGALYNVAARDCEVALAIADGVARWTRKVILVGLAGSVMLEVWREEGFAVAAEAFADRAYNSDGTLRSRALEGALLTDPEEAAAQALSIVRGGRIDTLCIHGDTPGSALIAAAVADRLTSNGVELRPLLL